MIKLLGNLFTTIVTLTCLGILIAMAGVFYLIFHYSTDLPNYEQLAEYNPPVTTRLYASDGTLLSEYAKEKRIFVPIEAIPERIKHAFIAAEDQNFYDHPGIDVFSVIRAAIQNMMNLGQNKSLVGGSTITQQVVKNFLLTNERSLKRKIKEAILAFRITQAFSKDRILELYLNEIFLGNRSYGVAAAAMNYFNKSIDNLTVEEAAMLAALPKAPSSLDPERNPEKAIARRNWVINRMEEEGYIDEAVALLAESTPIKLATRDETEFVSAEFFAETVRKDLEQQYGEKKLYEGGLTVRTTLDPTLQEYAENALIKGLVAYDRRHGWRGPITKNTINDNNWKDILDKTPQQPLIKGWQLAIVLALTGDNAVIGLEDGSKGKVELQHITWAKRYINRNTIGDKVQKPADVLSRGDVIVVSKNPENQDGYMLQQIPEINGGIVAMNPHTGRVLAMVGGYHFSESQFNRATQAYRQPGSAFKPFVYLAALENGYSPNTIIIDEAIQLEQGDNQPDWNPGNYSGKYYGPTTMRIGLEKSRNAMTVRLAEGLGIDKIIDIAKRFNINENPTRNFAVALGASETTLLKLANAYAIVANGGKKISPSLIERIQNANGETIYKRDTRNCKSCVLEKLPEDKNITPPVIFSPSEQLSDPISIYQITSMMEGVILRGTGAKARELGKTMAGKTGTTNKSVDTWFMGFSPNLVTGVYVGFDKPSSLGRAETGASAALPIWKEFMKSALNDKPDTPFKRPPGVKLVRVDANTGLLPTPDTPNHKIIYEAFKAGNEPTSSVPLQSEITNENGEQNFGTGGVY